MGRGRWHGEWHDLEFAFPHQLQGAACKPAWIHQTDPRIARKDRKSTKAATMLRVIDVQTRKVITKSQATETDLDGFVNGASDKNINMPMSAGVPRQEISQPHPQQVENNGNLVLPREDDCVTPLPQTTTMMRNTPAGHAPLMRQSNDIPGLVELTSSNTNVQTM